MDREDKVVDTVVDTEADTAEAEAEDNIVAGSTAAADMD